MLKRAYRFHIRQQTQHLSITAHLFSYLFSVFKKIFRWFIRRLIFDKSSAQKLSTQIPKPVNYQAYKLGQILINYCYNHSHTVDTLCGVCDNKLFLKATRESNLPNRKTVLLFIHNKILLKF